MRPRHARKLMAVRFLSSSSAILAPFFPNKSTQTQTRRVPIAKNQLTFLRSTLDGYGHLILRVEFAKRAT